jgi:RNA polymerase sigma factor for flagellar operon FliA
LVEDNLDVARKAAAMIFPRVRDWVEFEELVALGNAGLAEAAQRYEPDRATTFATYAWYRVQGAIIDGLRKMTSLPRRTWAKLVALRAASDYLEHRAERDRGAQQRGIAPPEGADALAAVRAAMSAIRTMYATSLEAMHDAGVELPSEAVEPGTQLDTGRMARRLAEAIDTLPPRERELMRKHYWDGKNLMEIGVELGISRSWACRLHAQAVERLRAIVSEG